MKKTTLLFTMLLVGQLFVFAQYTAIPDAAFESALSFFDDIPGDNQIPTANAAAATGTLNVSGGTFTDITGIEAFTGITGFRMNYNTAITSISFTAANASLQVIQTEGSSNLASIGVSALPNLTTIYSPDNNLSSIDVSSNTALTDFNVRNSQITGTLDLSNNVVLTNVEVRGNLISELDMRNGNNVNVVYFNADFNSNLTCIYVDDASAGYLSGWSKDAVSNFVNDELECTTLSARGFNQNSYTMYPNPVRNTLYVTTNMQDSSMEVYNVTGKLLFKKSLSFGKTPVSVSNLKPGVYLVKFSSGANSLTKKLIVN